MADINPVFSYFVDDAAVIARSADVPDASFVNGCNRPASNACGIGIGVDQGSVVGTPEQFTLLDQREIARTTQISQCIGGSGLGKGTEGTAPDSVIYAGDDANALGDGTVTSLGQASLVDLAIGWVAA
jgi:hypothetical protein